MLQEKIRDKISHLIRQISETKISFYDYWRIGLIWPCFRMLKLHLLLLLGIPQVERIFICPSHECNANCVHCYEKFIHKKFQKSLTTQQIKNVIHQFHKLGGCWIYFCSGEFLLRNDALELIKYARANHILVSIVTNGLLLDEKKIGELKIAGVTNLIVSIDSAIASKHDKLRGVKGCFKKAVNGLRIAKEKKLDTYIWTYVSKSNFNELKGISKLGKELGVSRVFVFFPLLSGYFFNKFDENISYSERELLRKKFNHKHPILLEFPTEKSLCRGGGLRHICVMPSGDVTFCPPVPYSYGNIAFKSLKDCLKDIVKDYKRFCFSKCTGQCPVNFTEYRMNCNAKFLYR